MPLLLGVVNPTPRAAEDFALRASSASARGGATIASPLRGYHTSDFEIL